MENPHVIIVGAGFAGLNAAKELAHTNVHITLVDRQNHHLFQPLLYQVATAVLSTQDIAAPIRKVLKSQKNATVLMDEVVDFDLERQIVHTATLELEYDFLIVAAGVRTHYFKPEWEEFAPGLKSLEDAMEIRRRVLLAYEAAEREQDPARRREWLNFAVVGAGPTGVELAGALAEIATRTLTANFRTFDPSDARVYLIEGQEDVMPAFPSKPLRKSAREQLEDLGVIVETGVLISGLGEDCIELSDGRVIPCRTVLWAAGIRGEGIGEKLGVELDKAGRVKVAADLTIPGYSNVFVAGDLAACTDVEGVEVPGLAPAALQMGVHAANNIRRAIGGREPSGFRYVDKGQMATIGRSKAIAMSGPLRFSGFVAWLAWLFIHVLYLIDFRNKFMVILEWSYSYLTWQKAARVVIHSPRALPAPLEAPDEEDLHEQEADIAV